MPQNLESVFRRERCAEDRCRPLRGMHETQKHLHSGRLAGTIRSQEAINRSLRDGEAHTIDHASIPIAFGEPRCSHRHTVAGLKRSVRGAPRETGSSSMRLGRYAQPFDRIHDATYHPDSPFSYVAVRRHCARDEGKSWIHKGDWHPRVTGGKRCRRLQRREPKRYTRAAARYSTGRYVSRYCSTVSIHCWYTASSFCRPWPEWGHSK